MKNEINFHYKLEPVGILKNSTDYTFVIDDDTYHLVPLKRNTNDLSSIYEINIILNKNNYLSYEIIMNNNNEIATIINDIPYILYKSSHPNNISLTLGDISTISKINIPQKEELNRSNWTKLWTKKIDYLEYQISQFGKKYPIIVDSFSYFVGLAENAISYISNIPNNKDEILTISHREITTRNIFTIYDPQNLVIDRKSRDIAEYIKLSFYEDNKNIYNELIEYFKYNYYTKDEISLLYGRVLYPSFYFKIYDDILEGKKEEKELIHIINNINKYEEYIYNIYLFLNLYYHIEAISWLEKKRE